MHSLFEQVVKAATALSLIVIAAVLAMGGGSSSPLPPLNEVRIVNPPPHRS